MKIKLNKLESQIIDDADYALFYLIESEGHEETKWRTIRKNFRKLLRDKFILSETK
tara:strand:- start:212 stop:379 length:168 start_codon:yes stop_codon:yes gene_type:complete